MKASTETNSQSVCGRKRAVGEVNDLGNISNNCLKPEYIQCHNYKCKLKQCCLFFNYSLLG